MPVARESQASMQFFPISKQAPVVGLCIVLIIKPDELKCFWLWSDWMACYLEIIESQK